jgi:phosphatidylserine/phosphatidylglycerophosphate/cardiolipin synthase-like enzyme
MGGILRAGETLWCERPVEAAGLLVDAHDYYAAFFRAARRARRSVLIAGWQFDSEVPLLRGETAEAEAGGRPVTLRAFLNDLCERNPELSIYLLAWDFHPVFALEREWLQQLLFAWTTNERLRFRFDASHVESGCHHQKFVVIDGQLSFVGGLDLCDHRWDDRRHLEANPQRYSRGAPHKPFHDVQSYLVGREVAAELASLFACRWRASGGEAFAPPDPPPGVAFGADYQPPGALPLRARRVALSRTDPRGAPTEALACSEVRETYRAAIASAERLIYIETQYFSSRAIGEALEARLRAPGRPALDVVLVLNVRAETLKEEIAVGLAQAKVLAGVRAAAANTGHRLGIYYTVPEPAGAEEPARATYIHAKLMVVDDRFLTVGSANLTNRSFSVDTELNASFEAGPADGPLAAGIAAARRSLLAEHLGRARLVPGDDLVARLDELARRREGRLRPHPSPTEGESAALAVIDPAALPFDPDAVEDGDEQRSLFAAGIGELWRRLFGETA